MIIGNETSFYKTSKLVQHSLTEMNQLKENDLYVKFQELKDHVAALEGYIKYYWKGDVPDIYKKLTIFLNKKFENVDNYFDMIESAWEPETVSNILMETADTLDKLKYRVNVVEKFLVTQDNYSVSA